MFDNILSSQPFPDSKNAQIGYSRGGRPLFGYRLGHGNNRVSLIAGAHADEPVGPLLLRKLLTVLHSLSSSHPLLTQYEWWIVPHANPDGEFVNLAWFDERSEAVQLPLYLRSVQREKPGDDIEFGFPRGESDSAARPENLAIYRWWRESNTGFAFHASLHGMAFAAGPWLLIDSSWVSRVPTLRATFSDEALRRGYRLHDMERHGDKGFFRIAPGFCTRPNSEAMAEHFRLQGDEVMAAKFRPSSMETVRTFGMDTLTLVTEMPLFVLPDIGAVLGPPDPAQVVWNERIQNWRELLAEGIADQEILDQAQAVGCTAMPVQDQMYFQWLVIEHSLQLLVPA